MFYKIKEGELVEFSIIDLFNTFRRWLYNILNFNFIKPLEGDELISVIMEMTEINVNQLNKIYKENGTKKRVELIIYNNE
jgi:hypothetical protein